jgi:hypothetical protein
MFGRRSNKLNNFISENLGNATLLPDDQDVVDEILINWLNMWKTVYPGVLKETNERDLVRKKVFDNSHLIKEFEIHDKVIFRVKKQLTSQMKPGKFKERFEGPAIIYEKTKEYVDSNNRVWNLSFPLPKEN